MAEPPAVVEDEEFDAEVDADVDVDQENLDMDENEEIDEDGTGELDKEAQKRLAMEYKDVVMQIDAQNKLVDTLKMKLCEKSIKPCRTRCEDREIRNIRCCLERENLKLQCLMKRAMNLQEEDPNRIWEAIPLATTYEEDSMPMSLNYKPANICYDMEEDGLGRASRKPSCQLDDSSNNITKRDLMKFVGSLIKQAKKQGRNPSKSCRSGDLDEATLRRIACALQNSVAQDSPQSNASCCANNKKPDNYQKVCKELHRSYSMQERLANDNAGLEGERYRLQEEILCRDKMIDGLQQKINCMQNEVQQLCRDRQKALMQDASCKLHHQPPQQRSSSCQNGNASKSVQRLENNIDAMESSMERLKAEMDCLRKERDRWESTVSYPQQSTDQVGNGNGNGFSVCDDFTQNDELCGSGKRTRNRSAEAEELRNNYTYLLAEYAKKDAELKEYKGRTKSFCDNSRSSGNGKQQNVDLCELEMLREKVTDMNEEQEEFKCLIKEQAEQLVEYQNKYLAAQQKVEEQKSILDKLEINNKRIEDQINLEIQRIKEKFQEKLKELAQLPKLLENEQLKLAACCKDKEDLEYKLRLVCKELKAVKAQMDSAEKVPDSTQKLKTAENDLLLMEKEVNDLKRDKDMLCEKLQKMKDDLDTLRSESARIIARTKERSEQTKQALQDRINFVEKELAQCRATACLSISDREEVIKEMQCQLNTIAYSFDSAQNQIKTLKTHIAFLSHDECMPVKC